MVNILFFFFALLFFCPLSYAAEPATLESRTTQELLLYYDWEEMLVEAPTRRPTSLKDVAENISIITAEEIRNMNVHSVNEILRTVTGIHMVFYEYYGGAGANYIHTSAYEHVLILLDGVRINDADQGFTDTTGIPVQIIDRIEIVKGPASSAWGTALGGIINIITKSGGNDRRPTRTVYASYGEGNSRDYRMDSAGKTGKVSYYLYGGFIETEGLKRKAVIPDNFFKSTSFYGKINVEPSKDVSLTLSTGYWSPDINNFDLLDSDMRNVYGSDNYYLSGKMAAALTPNLKLNLNVYYFNNEISDLWTALGTGMLGSRGDFLFQYNYDNSVFGGNTGLTWQKGRHAIAFGAEYYGGENDRSVTSGTLYQTLYGALPEEDLGKDDIKNLGIFFNDTIKWSRLTITPGLRYDRVEISDVYSEDKINPSLGMTLDISENTLVRATVAGGFARPGISTITGWPGTYGFPGNPNYKSETVRSCQAGIETDRFTKVHLKADLFYHRIEETWFFNNAAGYWDNGGVSKRKGLELNMVASPFENITAGLGYTYIRIEPFDDDESNFHALNAKLSYSDHRLGSFTLLGRYLRDGRRLSSAFTADYSNMIWDLHYNKNFFSIKATEVNLFVSVRNLFNGNLYWLDWYKNPRRWFEGGIRFTF
ncbi:MAG: TonB-dependent receptor [Deltaproteobacteria bacterium]|nr:TonB-dependent receptor [Deltaproteobacteria bacterium]